MDARVWTIPLLVVIALGGVAIYYSTTMFNDGRHPSPPATVSVDSAQVGPPGVLKRPPMMATATPVILPMTDDQSMASNVLHTEEAALGPAQVSPNGALVAYRGLAGGRTDLWVGPTDEPGSAKAMAPDSVGPVLDFVWAADSRRVLYMVDANHDGGWEVRCIDTATGTDSIVFDEIGVDARVTKVSPKHPELALIGISTDGGPYRDLYKVDLDTGERVLAYDNDGYAEFVVDEDLNVRMGVCEGENGYRILSDLREAHAASATSSEQPS